MRERLSLEVRDILKREKITAVLVTHDQNEAFNIADMVGIMKDGRIEQWDTPYRLYHEPRTRYAAEFIGQGLFLPGTVLADGRIRLALGEFFPAGRAAMARGQGGGCAAAPRRRAARRCQRAAGPGAAPGVPRCRVSVHAATARRWAGV